MKIIIKILISSFLFSILTVSSLTAQQDCSFEHYGSEDGLPQNNITDILQDKKGFMWFGTRDGLAKFDGYNFRVIDIHDETRSKSKSNRVDYITEDKYGNIWVLLYDSYVYRYNPKTEQRNSIIEDNDTSLSTTKIITFESGKVWLLSENQGCVCITDSSLTYNLYNKDNSLLPSNKVYNIYEDKNLNSWILSKDGVLQITPDNKSQLLLHSDSDLFPKENHPAFCASEQNNELWIGSNNGTVWVYNYNEERVRQIKTGIDAPISSIHKLSNEKILLTTNENGFSVYNVLNKTFEHFNTSTCKEVFSDVIYNTYVDYFGNAWFETDITGVCKFNSHTNVITYYTPKIETMEPNVFLPNFFIFEDVNKRLWIHPRGGGFGYYDRENDKLTPFFNEPHSSECRFSNVLHSAFSDRQGNLWIGTRSHGLEKVTFSNKYFGILHVSPEINSFVANDVRPIFQDSRNNVWIGTKDGKVHIYNDELKPSGFLNKSGKISNDSNFKGVAYCITEDSQQNIWIGTKGEGLYKLSPKDNNHFEIQNFKNSKDDLYSLSNDNIYTIFEDNKNRIWIGTYGGGINLIVQESDSIKFLNHYNDLKNYPHETASQVRIISSDHYGNIFVGTTFGLIVFSSDFNSPAKINFKTYYAQNDKESLSANDIFDICTTRNGETFMAVFGGGVSKVFESDNKGLPVKFKTYSTHDGLPSNVTLSIVEDPQDNLLISTESHIARFNPDTETFKNLSEIKQHLKQQIFSEGSRALLNNGKILFGCSDGVLHFNSNELINDSYEPYLALVDFKLFNNKVDINNKSPLTQNIDDIQKIKLKYNQNFFTIEFAGLDFKAPDDISYAYKLEGFDKDWIYNKKLRTANYTNLSRGKYTFKVKSTNNNGIWSDNQRTLSIEVLPPLWKTWWAYLIYFILFSLIIFFSLRFLFSYYKIRQLSEFNRIESEFKAKYFTDISHEIRTPLTMIVSPIENILKDTSTPDKIKNQLTLVSKNTDRLLTMVNQILDFRKIEKQSIEVSKIEIGAFVEEVCNRFIEVAKKEEIYFNIKNNSPGKMIWADTDALETILVNLLSNAFKYTPAGKAVVVKVSVDNKFATIEVEDQGKGISKEKINRLFKRFESFNEDKNKPSTGIGLSIVKELMDKHSAKIFVESESGVGTLFSLLFHTGTTHFKSDVIINEKGTKHKTMTPDGLVMDVSASDLNIYDSVHKPTVLVVEDDDDLREFIVTTLEKEYKILEAENGKEGLKLASEMIPDFIISDIMMPEMDGIELLHNVRKNIATSHILFLLLTAKTSDIDIIDGFESGADEYLTKPFSVSYLQARIKSLIKRQKNIQNYYQNKGVIKDSQYKLNHLNDEEVMPVLNETDSKFIEDVTNFIIENRSNSDYLVDDIAANIGLGRTVFYKKIKGLTGLSPIEFKRNILLEEAVKLLAQKKYKVNEIAFMVGFTDAKYFSKCFKQKFKMTPSSYAKTIKS